MAATMLRPSDGVLDIRPGDKVVADAGTAWLLEYATSRDPALRERIILAYLGLADRLASRYRHSRGTTPEDLTQTARAGLIAAVDRYDPDYGTPFVPYAVACVVGELKLGICATPAGGCTCPGRSRNRRCGCAGRPMSCTSAWVAHLPPPSWPSSWTWTKRRSWTGWRPGQPP